MYQPPTSPQSIGGVLDSGFKLFGACFTQVFLFALVLALLSVPFALAAPLVAGREITPVLGTGIGVAVLAVIAIAAIVASAMIARIDGVARGAPLSVAAALGVGARRFIIVILAGFLMSLTVAAIPLLVACAAWLAGTPLLTAMRVFVLLCVPFSIIMIWLAFAPYLAITDRLGPIKSLIYSRAITRGHWWRTAALITILAIIVIVLYVVLVLVLGIFVALNPPSAENPAPPWYFQVVVGPIMEAVIAPLSYSLLMSILYDLKLRHEGGDLAARIAASA